MMQPEKIQRPQVPDLPSMTAHPTTQPATLGAYDQTLVAVSALVFPELKVEIDAWARLDVDLREADHISSET